MRQISPQMSQLVFSSLELVQHLLLQCRDVVQESLVPLFHLLDLCFQSILLVEKNGGQIMLLFRISNQEVDLLLQLIAL